jgi:hypothetical protein
MLIAVQLDFAAYFEHAHLKLAGFTNTRCNMATAQAFRIARATSGRIELRWKPRASLTEPWLGVDATADSAGFALMKWIPQGVPAIIPSKVAMPKAQVKQMLSFKMRKTLLEQDCPGAFDWIKEVAEKSRVPLSNEIERTRAPGRMGRLGAIGTENRCHFPALSSSSPSIIIINHHQSSSSSSSCIIIIILILILIINHPCTIIDQAGRASGDGRGSHSG